MNDLHSDKVFSILITSWNNLEALKITIESIRKNSLYQHQIIVHINNGEDGSLKWVQENEIEYTYTRLNVGFCYSINTCSSLAYCDYVLLTEDCNYFCPGWDMYLMSSIKRQPNDFWCISPTSIEHRKIASYSSIAPYYFGDTPQSFDEEQLLFCFDQISFTNWYGVNRQALLLKRIVWTAIGGFSVEFNPGNSAHSDLAMKLWSLGVRNFIGVANSRLYHIGHQPQAKSIRNDGKKTFLQKWHISEDSFHTYYLSDLFTPPGKASVPAYKVVEHFFALLLSIVY